MTKKILNTRHHNIKKAPKNSTNNCFFINEKGGDDFSTDNCLYFQEISQKDKNVLRSWCLLKIDKLLMPSIPKLGNLSRYDFSTAFTSTEISQHGKRVFRSCYILRIDKLINVVHSTIKWLRFNFIIFILFYLF